MTMWAKRNHNKQQVYFTFHIKLTLNAAIFVTSDGSKLAIIFSALVSPGERSTFAYEIKLKLIY